MLHIYNINVINKNQELEITHKKLSLTHNVRGEKNMKGKRIIVSTRSCCWSAVDPIFYLTGTGEIELINLLVGIALILVV